MLEKAVCQTPARHITCDSEAERYLTRARNPAVDARGKDPYSEHSSFPPRTEGCCYRDVVDWDHRVRRWFACRPRLLSRTRLLDLLFRPCCHHANLEVTHRW